MNFQYILTTTFHISLKSTNKWWMGEMRRILVTLTLPPPPWYMKFNGAWKAFIHKILRIVVKVQNTECKMDRREKWRRWRHRVFKRSLNWHIVWSNYNSWPHKHENAINVNVPFKFTIRFGKGSLIDFKEGLILSTIRISVKYISARVDILGNFSPRIRDRRQVMEIM